MDSNELKGCLVNLYDGKRIRMDCSTGFSIGRIPIKNNEGLYIEDPIISREHAHIINEENQFYMVDLNSKNGTKINGTELEPYKKYQLSQYSLIEFSKIKYRFEYEQDTEKVDLGYGTLQIIDINGQKKCCIELPYNVDIIEYQKEMIDHNPYHNLMEMSILSSDKGSRIYYNLSNMTALDTIIQEKKLSKKDLINLFFSIFEVIKQTERLLLFPECFVLHPKGIFYKEDKQPCFIYLPINREDDFLNQIKSLMMELVGKYLDGNEKEFKKQVLTTLSSKDVNLDHIRSMMIESQEINTMAVSDNIRVEANDIKKSKWINLGKQHMNNKIYFLLFQGIVLLFLGFLVLISGLEMNQKIGLCLIALGLDGWFANNWIKKRKKVSDEGPNSKSTL